MSARPLAIIVGVGVGLGASVSRAFGATHAVALLARSSSTADATAQEIIDAGGDAKAFSCDVVNKESVVAAFESIKKSFPGAATKVAVFNANSRFVMAPFLELTAVDIHDGMDVNTIGAFNFAQAVLPLLLEHKTGGTLIFTGATASTKGSAKFAAFAPPKFALRGLAQCLAREFHPLGVHVAHTIIDGLIDSRRMDAMMGGPGLPGTRMDPDEMAKTYVALHEQDRSTWTQELDLRPFSEKF